MRYFESQVDELSADELNDINVVQFHTFCGAKAPLDALQWVSDSVG